MGGGGELKPMKGSGEVKKIYGVGDRKFEAPINVSSNLRDFLNTEELVRGGRAVRGADLER